MHENNKNHTEKNEVEAPELSEESFDMEADEDPAAIAATEEFSEKEKSDAELLAEGYEPYQPKLTEKQRKVIEIIAGLVAGFLIWFTLGLSSVDQDNTLFRWLFLIIFAGVMISKNQIEKRTGLVLKTFTRFFLIGLIIFLGVFLLYGFQTGLL